MVIRQNFLRHLYSISSPIRMKPLGNDANKRLFFEKNKNSTFKTICRNFAAYDGDGKTVGFVLNKKHSEELLLKSVTPNSFYLSNGAEFVGSMILFPHSIMSWHVTAAKDVNEDSLVLFKILEPKIDILVFGFGLWKDYTPEVRENFTKCCKNLGIRFEALPTEHAIGTYNFLASERRLVAAALIPPSNIDMLKFDRNLPLFLEDEEDDEGEEPISIDAGTSKGKLLK